MFWLSVAHGLFTNMISMFSMQIERQPRTGGTLKLHFDRLSASMKDVTDQIAGNRSACKKVVSQGVWKSKGRRGNQEDSFGKSALEY
jgi:hypothetical protein